MNDNTFHNEFIEESDFHKHIGDYQLEEIKKISISYIEEDSDDFVEKYNINNPSAFAFFHLRGVQEWLEAMWLIKDNGAYVRDGHFYVPHEHLKIGIYEKVSLDGITSTSEGDLVSTNFTKEEITFSKELIDDLYIDLSDFDYDGKLPTLNPFGKKYPRVPMARHFSSLARRKSNLALQIFYYCIALQCLFTNDKTEVSHKIAERAAYLIGKNGEERKEFYKNIINAYNYRSYLTHGNTIKENNEILMQMSKFLDTILREIFVTYQNVFKFKKR